MSKNLANRFHLLAQAHSQKRAPALREMETSLLALSCSSKSALTVARAENELAQDRHRLLRRLASGRLMFTMQFRGFLSNVLVRPGRITSLTAGDQAATRHRATLSPVKRFAVEPCRDVP
jgi:hypothetical protein